MSRLGDIKIPLVLFCIIKSLFGLAAFEEVVLLLVEDDEEEVLQQTGPDMDFLRSFARYLLYLRPQLLHKDFGPVGP